MNFKPDTNETDLHTSDILETEDLEIKPEEQSKKGKKEKKLKKVKNQKAPASKKRVFFTSLFLSIITAVVGGMGGYVLFDIFNPTETNSFVDYNTEYDAAKIQSALAAGSANNQKAVDLANYALDLQAKSPYALTIGQGTVNAAAGVKQTIESCTYATPDGIFNQNISDSSMVHTANRFYDDMEKMKTYVCKKPDEWKSSLASKDMTYDEYIQSNGRLIKGEYWISEDTSDASKVVPEKYVGTTESKGPKNHRLNGVIIYTLTSGTVTDSSVKKTDGGYHLSLTLDFEKATFYYTVQMKTTGGLDARPNFTSAMAQFDIDNDGYLVSSIFKDSYRVKTGITTNADDEMTQYYFHSDTSTFTNKDGKSVEVKIPTMDEKDFVGYQLFPSEEK